MFFGYFLKYASLVNRNKRFVFNELLSLLKLSNNQTQVNI